jgi:uncharacterized membrane protein
MKGTITMETTKSKPANGRQIALDLTLNGLLIALVFVFTMFIQIRLPISVNGGLIHLGNIPLVVAAIVFGRKKGAAAGAFGMALFDLLSGWALWAPFTFVVRGLMGYIIGGISGIKKGQSWLLNLLAILAGGAVMIIGYYFTEVIIYHNWITPLSSIPGNAVQVVSALLIGLPLATTVGKKWLTNRK